MSGMQYEEFTYPLSILSFFSLEEITYLDFPTYRYPVPFLVIIHIILKLGMTLSAPMRLTLGRDRI